MRIKKLQLFTRGPLRARAPSGAGAVVLSSRAMSLVRTIRRIAAPLAVLLGAGGLAGCVSSPPVVASLPAGDSWLVLPVQDWAAEERGRPEGVAACLVDDCPDKLMVSVLSLRGEAAEEARAVLADPRRLVAYLEARDREDETEARRAVTTRATARPIRADGLEGFVVTLTGEGGRTARTAYGATLARAEGRELRVALVVGDDEAAVEAAVRQLAAEAF